LLKRTIVSLLGGATIVVMVAATVTDASAWWQRGWGPGIAAGVVGGAVSSPAPSLPRGLLAGLSTKAMRHRSTRQAVIGRLRWCRPRRRLYWPAGASLPRLLGASAWQCGRSPARVCWGPARWRSCRLLHAAFPVIRSENRNLSGQRWPAPFLSVSQLAERMLIWADQDAPWPNPIFSAKLPFPTEVHSTAIQRAGRARSVIYDSGMTSIETWRALQRLVDDGQRESIGLSMLLWRSCERSSRLRGSSRLCAGRIPSVSPGMGPARLPSGARDCTASVCTVGTCQGLQPSHSASTRHRLALE
jgi:hypothetical protein